MKRIAWVCIFFLSTLYAQDPNNVVQSDPGPHPTLVKFAWDPSTDTSVVGYRIHFGFESRNYTITKECGLTVRYDMVGILEVGKKYFVAVTCYNTLGLESDYSNEISVIPIDQNNKPPSPPGNYRKQ